MPNHKRLLPVLLLAIACGGSDDEEGDCRVELTEAVYAGNTMTAVGTTLDAQPVLILNKGNLHQEFAGIETTPGHFTFDLTGLPAGTWSYEFDASCHDEGATSSVDAPEGQFTKT